MSAQVNRQTDTSEGCNLARAHQVLLLAAAPALHEKHAGQQCRRTHHGTGDVVTTDCYPHALFMRAHVADLPLRISTWDQAPDRSRGNKWLPPVGAPGPRHKPRRNAPPQPRCLDRLETPRALPSPRRWL